MSSGYGLEWVGEAKAVYAVVKPVAVDFAESLSDEIDRLADDPAPLAVIADPSAGGPIAYTFWWHAYAVTVVVALSERLGVLYIHHVTVESGVGGINPY